MGELRQPLLAGDVLQRERFPFTSWATANGFGYPAWAADALQHCGSAAEAYFVRAFCERSEARAPAAGPSAFAVLVAGDTFLRVQVAHRLSRISVVGRFSLSTSLAVLIDTRIHRGEDATEADYLRDRRLALDGYVVVPFSAREVFRDSAECWRQVDAILDAWSALEQRERVPLTEAR